MNTFEWLEMSALAEWVGASMIGYPLMLASHGVGMAIVIGIIFMLNLRLIGCFRGISLGSFNGLLKLAWGGFVLNFLSGCALFTAQATVFIESTPFLIKVFAIFLAGINAALLQSALRKNADHWDSGVKLPRSVQIMAVSSITLWSIAIIAGRMIAYLDVA